MSEPSKIRPVIILPPDEMSEDDIGKLNNNGFCVVVAKHPDQVRFMEPPLQSYPAPERAALKLCRVIMASREKNVTLQDLTQRLCDFLMEGVPIPGVTQLQPAKQCGEIKNKTP